MAFLTPGLRFFIKALPILLFPTALIYTSLHFLQSHTTFTSVRYARLIAILLGNPIILACFVQHTKLKKRRDAARLGAKLLPEVKGKWIGNIDRLIELVEMFDKSYPGLSLPAQRMAKRIQTYDQVIHFGLRCASLDPS